MIPTRDIVLVRITRDDKEGVLSKMITRDDGTKVRLFTNVSADKGDERRDRLFVRTAVIEAVGPEVKEFKKGDIAILNYEISNSVQNIMYEEDGDTIFWLNANTTYHDHTEIAYRNRKNKGMMRRDQIVFSKGELDMLSSLLGVIRGDKLIPNDPYVFLAHQDNERSMVSASGLLYKERDKMLVREVLACSASATRKYTITPGTNVLVDDFDCFTISLDSGTIDCVNDSDVMALVK